MSIIIAELRDNLIKQYGTAENTFSTFPVGCKVKVITPCCDFTFFYGETGTVTKNTGEYLGITVTFDKPRREGRGKKIMHGFNFNPIDLYYMGFPTRFELMDLE